MPNENRFDAPRRAAIVNIDNEGHFFWQQAGPKGLPGLDEPPGLEGFLPPANPAQFVDPVLAPVPPPAPRFIKALEGVEEVLTNLDKLRAIRDVYFEHGDEPPDLIIDLITELLDHEEDLRNEWDRGFDVGHNDADDDAYHRGYVDGKEEMGELMEGRLEDEYDRGFKDGKGAVEQDLLWE